MGVTISTHNGSDYRRDHNVRNRRVTDKEGHIDPKGHYEIWDDEKPRDAYERIFGEAVEQYNKKQTREDRKITDYYRKVCEDEKQHPVYEMIIGIYGRNEDGTRICSEELGKQIMWEFYEDWVERNPNLEIIGAYYHADEPDAEPHVHIDYIPVAHGYKNGMETQNGLVRALGEMGFEKQGKATAQIQWEARENKVFDSLCRSYGLEVEHPRIEGVKHLDTSTYKAQKQLEKVIDHTNDLDKRIKAQNQEITALQEKKGELRKEVKSLKGERKKQKDLQKEIAGKTLLGRPRKTVKLDYEEYRSTKRLAHEVEDVEAQSKLNSEKAAELEEQRKSIERSLLNAQQMEDKARASLEWAEKAKQKQADIIYQVADQRARELIDEIMKPTNTKEAERMEKFMKNVEYEDGSTVWERFQKQEQELKRKLEQQRSWLHER